MRNQIPVYVRSFEGKVLMPTYRRGRVRHLLQRREAKIVNRDPFTIQLCYSTTEHIQRGDIQKKEYVPPKVEVRS